MFLGRHCFVCSTINNDYEGKVVVEALRKGSAKTELDVPEKRSIISRRDKELNAAFDIYCAKLPVMRQVVWRLIKLEVDQIMVLNYPSRIGSGSEGVRRVLLIDLPDVGSGREPIQ